MNDRQHPLARAQVERAVKKLRVRLGENFTEAKFVGAARGAGGADLFAAARKYGAIWAPAPAAIQEDEETLYQVRKP